jgi:hypothetical protein
MNNHIERILKGKYRVEDGIPIFIDNVPETKTYPKLLRFLSPPDTTYEEEPQKEAFFWRSINMSPEGFMLNIGSCSRVYPGAINLDIGKFKNVDVVADGRELPFKNNVFSTIFIESVLEHVDEPEKVIKESYRVLRKG